MDEYLDFARGLKKQWNQRGLAIPIIVGAFRTVLKGLQRKLKELEIRERIETLQITVLW